MDSGRHTASPTPETVSPNDGELYRAILESQTEAVCRYRADGTITFANAAYSTMFGRSADEILGLNIFSLIQEPEARQNIKDVIERLTTIRFEHERLTPDGQTRWQQWVDQPVYNPAGEVIEFQGVGRDITERKRMEDALKHTESLYRNLARNLPDIGVILFDHDLRYWLVEGPTLKGFGFSKEELEGKTLFDTLSPEAANVLLPYYLTALKGEVSTFEREVNGLTYNAQAAPLRNDTGEVIGGMMVIQDITARKWIENSLRENVMQFGTLVAFSPVGIFQTDLNGACVFVNDRWCEMSGVSFFDAQGQGWIQALHPDDRERVLNEWLDAAQNQHEFATEFRFVHQDGTIRWIQSNAVAVRDADGVVNGFIGTTTDMTRHKDAEHALKESQRFIQKVNETAPDLIMVFELSDWGSLYFNQDTAGVFGYSAVELQHIGGLPAIMHPEDLLKIPDHFKHLTELADADKYEYEFRAHHKNGTWGWYQSHNKVFNRDERGKPVQILAVTRNISNRKQTEIALQESEELFRLFAENTERLFWMSEVDNPTPFYLNQAFEKIYGVAPADIYSGKYNMLDFVHPDDRASTFDYLRNLRETGSQDTEFRIIRLDGTLRWIMMRTFPIHNPQGELYRMGSIAEDITARKEAALELQESEMRFRQLAENIEYAFWILSGDGESVIYISPAYETIWGRTCESLYKSPKSFAEAIVAADYAHFAEQRMEKMLNGTYDVEYRITRPDDTIRWIHTKAFPVRDKNGVVYRIAGVSEDVTEHKLMEKENFALELEKENVRLSSSFIRNTSHDLRTPLSTISLGVYMLSKTTDPQKRSERALIIEQQITRLNALIDELHEMSRLDSSAQVGNYAINLNIVIESLIARSTTAFAAKNLRAHLSLQPGLPLVKADERDMSMAFKSLLDNAIRYTASSGSITVRSYAQDENVVIEVQDTGIGIPPEDIPLIFRRFYKVDQSRTGDGSGAGLGLSIAQRIIQMHGGRIEVSSVLGEGSTFCVYLPTSSAVESLTDTPSTQSPPA